MLYVLVEASEPFRSCLVNASHWFNQLVIDGGSFWFTIWLVYRLSVVVGSCHCSSCCSPASLSIAIQIFPVNGQLSIPNKRGKLVIYGNSIGISKLKCGKNWESDPRRLQIGVGIGPGLAGAERLPGGQFDCRLRKLTIKFM